MLYRARGIAPEQEQLVYRQVMGRASHTHFELRWLGLPWMWGDDESREDWGIRDDTPVQHGPQRLPPGAA